MPINPTIKPVLAAALLIMGAIAMARILTGPALDTELQIAGDFLSVAAIMRTFLETGSYYGSPSLAWPVGMDPTAYPLTNWGIWVVMTALRPFFNATEVLAYVITIQRVILALSMLAAYWVLRVLGSARVFAILGACSFVAIDFVAGRSFAHFFLIDLFVIPLGVLSVFAALGRVSQPLPVLLAASFVAGLGNIYWIFTSAMLLSLVVGSFVVARAPRADIQRAAALLGAMLLPFLCFLVINSLGDMSSVPKRQPEEQTIHALRFVEAFVPWIRGVTDDSFATYWSRVRVGWGEGGEFVGYLSDLGLVVACIALLMRTLMKAEVSPTVQMLSIVGLLAGYLIIFALPAGLGGAFNLLVSAMIRAQNRLSVPIAFLGLIGAALMATAWQAKLMNRKPILGLLPIVLLAPLTVFDIDRTRDFPARSDCARGIVSRSCEAHVAAQLKPVFEKISTANLSKLVIFPVAPFAEAGGSGDRSDYFGFLPYVFEPLDTDLSYSYGMLRTDALYQALDATEAALAEGKANADIAEKLTCAGYDGVLIDRVAYDDRGQTVQAGLEASGADTLVLEDDYALVALPQPEAQGQPAHLADCLAVKLTMNADRTVPESVFADGWWQNENWGRWASSAAPTLVWRENPDLDAELIVIGLRGFVGGSAAPTRKIKIIDGAGRELFAYTATPEITDARVTLALEDIASVGGIQRLTFQTEAPRSPAELFGAADGRALSVGLTQLSLQ